MVRPAIPPRITVWKNDKCRHPPLAIGSYK
jgi:hypothetical protein